MMKWMLLLYFLSIYKVKHYMVWLLLDPQRSTQGFFRERLSNTIIHFNCIWFYWCEAQGEQAPGPAPPKGELLVMEHRVLGISSCTLHLCFYCAPRGTSGRSPSLAPADFNFHLFWISRPKDWPQLNALNFSRVKKFAENRREVKFF